MWQITDNSFSLDWSRRFLVVSSSLLPSLFSLSLSLFFSESVQLLKTHTKTHKHTQKHADSAYTRERYIFAPPLEAFSNPKVVFIFFLFPPFFFYREKKGNVKNKIRILFTKIISPVGRICNAAATVARGRGRWFVKPWSVRGR